MPDVVAQVVAFAASVTASLQVPDAVTEVDVQLLPGSPKMKSFRNTTTLKLSKANCSLPSPNAWDDTRPVIFKTWRVSHISSSLQLDRVKLALFP
jgi:hypothetical protein